LKSFEVLISDTLRSPEHAANRYREEASAFHSPGDCVRLGRFSIEMMRQVPWESWQQWHHVRCCFFSNEPVQFAEALDRVAAWQSRGGLPVAVEITAELISIQQRDPYMNTGVSPSIALPGEMLRMMYAMAIMRLVNGVVDQNARRNTASVANRAEDAGLPRAFVDIRHETSHNELPSLPLVRHASKQALEWLQRNYWVEQDLLLPNTQGTLKTKLLEHAQVVFEILVTQQKLLSKETKGQENKQQRLALKRALKGMPCVNLKTQFISKVPVVCYLCLC
jgi:predicted Rdx family selenoprotein